MTKFRIKYHFEEDLLQDFEEWLTFDEILSVLTDSQYDWKQRSMEIIERVDEELDFIKEEYEQMLKDKDVQIEYLESETSELEKRVNELENKIDNIEYLANSIIDECDY